MSLQYAGPATKAQWTQWERVKAWPGTRRDEYGDIYTTWLQDCQWIITDVEERRANITAAELAAVIIELTLKSMDLWYKNDKTPPHDGDVLRLF